MDRYQYLIWKTQKKEMTQEQLVTFFKNRPFNCHFNLYVNIVTVLSNVSLMAENIRIALQFGVPYVADNMGKMPLIHAKNINDKKVIKVFTSHMSQDVNKVN